MSVERRAEEGERDGAAERLQDRSLMLPWCLLFLVFVFVLFCFPVGYRERLLFYEVLSASQTHKLQ